MRYVPYTANQPKKYRDIIFFSYCPALLLKKRAFCNTFTCMHLADKKRFYPKRLTVHSGYTIFFFYQYVCSLGIEPTTFCAANAMLYHWAPGTLLIGYFARCVLLWPKAVVSKLNLCLLNSNFDNMLVQNSNLVFQPIWQPYWQSPLISELLS